MLHNEEYKRKIKSFVLRQGKMTQGQIRAINELLPKYGVSFDTNLLDLNAVFGRNNSKIIEIGFGMGQATSIIAQNNPDIDYLGIEVHAPGVGSLLLLADDAKINNLRVIHHDAVEVITHMIANNSIDGIHIYFPDPWHKKRHNKRRLIQHEFIALLCSKLKPNGYIHLATDWQDYAIWMLNILANNQDLINQSPTNDFVTRPSYRPETKFEKRGLNLGHGVWDIVFKKNENV